MVLGGDAYGGARGPRLQGAHKADRRRGPRPRDLGDGQPADREGPRRRHGALLGEVPRHEAVARPGLRGAAGEGVDRLAAADERDPQGVALHQLRLLRLGVQLDGVRPRVPRAAGAREGVPLRRRPARPGRGRAARGVQLRARDLGLHALLLLHRAVPEGRRPAGRDREARGRVDQARDRPRHGREAREVVRDLGEDDGLAPGDGARPEDAGRHLGDQADGLRDRPRQARQGAAARASARGRERRRGAAALRPRQAPGPGRRRRDRAWRARDRALRPARRRRPGAGEPRRARGHAGRGAGAGRRLMRKVAYYRGCLASLSAKELDSSTQALAPKVGLELVELETVTCCGAGDIHEAEPDYYLHLNARILAYAEEAGTDTLLTICNVCTLNLRQANVQLQNDEELLDRVNLNLEAVGVPRYSGAVDVRHLLWEIADGEGYELLKQAAHKGLKGLRVAPFYGCQILRPSKLLGFEDPDRPWSLERIIAARGGAALQ